MLRGAVRSCTFINLATAHERRAAVEASFAAASPSGWALERFEALTPADISETPGTLKPAEKACFASHRAALGRHLADDEPVLLAEDDVVFSSKAFGVLDMFLERAPHWDVIFTDIALFDLGLMVQLARRRDEMVRRGEFQVTDIGARSVAGATSYVVRGEAKARLHAELSAAEALDQPYDLFLRDLGRAGKLKMGVCFPYLTTVSPLADRSQIQAGSDLVFDETLSAFRRLMFVERDLEQCRRDAARLRAAHGDEVSEMVGTVFGTLVSPAFPLDR